MSETANGPGGRARSRSYRRYFFRALLLAALRFVTRVAAVLLEDEDLLPRFLGEIFFSAMRSTPFGSRPGVCGHPVQPKSGPAGTERL